MKTYLDGGSFGSSTASTSKVVQADVHKGRSEVVSQRLEHEGAEHSSDAAERTSNYRIGARYHPACDMRGQGLWDIMIRSMVYDDTEYGI